MELALCYPVPEAYRYSKQIGCRKGYLDICWPRIQPEPGVFDFSYYDPIIAEAKALGLELIGMVSSRRSTFPDGHWIWHNHRGMLPDPGAWGEFLEVVTNRYKETIRYWEVWSEPNCLDCNPMNYYDPLLYRKVLKLASSTIRGVDPTAKLVLGGLWLNNILQDYVEALFEDEEVTEYFDIFSWHLYLMETTREWLAFSTWREPLRRLVSFFRSFLPESYPVWITEFGLPTVTDQRRLNSRTAGEITGLSEEAQADWFCQFVRFAEEELDIGLLVWLMLADKVDPERPDHFANNLGLLRADGSEKPVAASIAHHQARPPQQRYIK